MLNREGGQGAILELFLVCSFEDAILFVGRLEPFLESTHVWLELCIAGKPRTLLQLCVALSQMPPQPDHLHTPIRATRAPTLLSELSNTKRQRWNHK